MILQPIRRTAAAVANCTGELLPHLFTLIRQLTDGYFLLHYSTLADCFPLGSMVLCVARTFLLAKGEATNRLTVFQLAKVVLFAKNPLFYFNHLSNQPINVRCHSTPFCGFSTQWFSSGKISISDGTPRSTAALKAAMPCEANMR